MTMPRGLGYCQNCRNNPPRAGEKYCDDCDTLDRFPNSMFFYLRCEKEKENDK